LPGDSRSQTTCCTIVTVIDGTGTAGKTHQNVLISGDRILHYFRIYGNTQWRDRHCLEGKILMPLIVDCHTHWAY